HLPRLVSRRSQLPGRAPSVSAGLSPALPGALPHRRGDLQRARVALPMRADPSRGAGGELALAEAPGIRRPIVALAWTDGAEHPAPRSEERRVGKEASSKR